MSEDDLEEEAHENRARQSRSMTPLGWRSGNSGSLPRGVLSILGRFPNFLVQFARLINAKIGIYFAHFVSSVIMDCNVGSPFCHTFSTKDAKDPCVSPSIYIVV